jgi:hypothetical protein
LFQQTFEGCIALPELREAATLSELLLIEEQSIWRLLDIMSEATGCKGLSCVCFNYSLFEIVIDLEQEWGGWLLLVRRLYISRVLLQDVK